jgi:plastocyanin
MPTRIVQAGSILAVVGVLTLSGCTDSTSTGAPAASPLPVPSSSSAAPSPASSPASAATTSSPAVTLNVKVTNGKVAPKPAKIRVPLGQTVTINATSDVADELHVHAFEQEVELQPGQTDRLTFVADQSGSFVVELHHQELIVATLIVS